VAEPDELWSDPERAGRGTSDRPSWVWRGLALAALVAVAAVVGPGLIAGSEDDGSRDGRSQRPEPSESTAPSRTRAPTVAPPSALRWVVRGSLAGDEEFAAAALALVQEQQEPGAEKVLYAAELPDRSRLALVAAGDQGSSEPGYVGSAMHSVHVPAGAEVTAGRVGYAGSVHSDEALVGWAGRVNGSVLAVLLGRPAPLDARLSSRIRYQADGSASRTWRKVVGRDGSATVDLGRDVDRLVAATTRTGEALTYPLLMIVDGELTATARERIAGELRIVGGPGGGPESLALRRAVVDGSWIALEPRRARIRVLWSGELPTGQRAFLLRMRRADGPVFQLFVREHDEALFAEDIRHVPWGDSAVLPWVVQPGEPGKPMLLINPSGAGTAVLTPGEGAGRRVPIDADGVADLGDEQVDGLSGSVVTVLSPSGRLLARTTWLDQFEADPLVLELP